MPSDLFEESPQVEDWRRQLALILFWSWNIVVFQGAILPGNRIPRFLFRFNDKLLHAVEYFILFFAAFSAFRMARRAWLRCRPLFNSLLWCFWMGLLTEWVQAFVPDRHPSVADWVADFVGAVLGVIFYIVLRQRPYRVR